MSWIYNKFLKLTSETVNHYKNGQKIWVDTLNKIYGCQKPYEKIVNIIFH